MFVVCPISTNRHKKRIFHYYISGTFSLIMFYLIKGKCFKYRIKRMQVWTVFWMFTYHLILNRSTSRVLCVAVFFYGFYPLVDNLIGQASTFPIPLCNNQPLISYFKNRLRGSRPGDN